MAQGKKKCMLTFNNLNEMDKILEKHILPKLAQEKTEIFKELYIHFQN